MHSDKLLPLAIARLPGIRLTERLLLDDVVDSVEFFRSLDGCTVQQIIGRRMDPVAFRPEEALRQAERDLDYCTRRSIGIITFWDSRYPAALREIFDPPLLLFVRGSLPADDRPVLAVVGTREPSAAAVAAAESIAADLAAGGFPVVSGLARGIDAAAHRGAIRACHGGAPTGAVLGCGIDGVCPASNRILAGDILQSGGFIMSEYPPGTRPAKYHFPARNRIISGISRGVVVVQAPARSGALITAEYALDQGRDLFVHSAGITGAVGAGTHELAQDGARIVSGACDVYDEWGLLVTSFAGVRGAAALRAEVEGRGAVVGARLAESMRRTLALEGQGVHE